MTTQVIVQESSPRTKVYERVLHFHRRPCQDDNAGISMWTGVITTMLARNKGTKECDASVSKIWIWNHISISLSLDMVKICWRTNCQNSLSLHSHFQVKASDVRNEGQRQQWASGAVAKPHNQLEIQNLKLEIQNLKYRKYKSRQQWSRDAVGKPHNNFLHSEHSPSPRV